MEGRGVGADWAMLYSDAGDAGKLARPDGASRASGDLVPSLPRTRGCATPYRAESPIQLLTVFQRSHASSQALFARYHRLSLAIAAPWSAPCVSTSRERESRSVGRVLFGGRAVGRTSRRYADMKISWPLIARTRHIDVGRC